MKYLNQYVWSDKYGESRVLTRYENDQGLDKLICLNGLNTGQSVDDNNSDIYIKPVQQYNNPFYKRTKELEPSIFVCEVMLDNTTPHSSNERLNSIKTLENYDDVKMSITNEFFIMVSDAVSLSYEKCNASSSRRSNSSLPSSERSPLYCSCARSRSSVRSRTFALRRGQRIARKRSIP